MCKWCNTSTGARLHRIQLQMFGGGCASRSTLRAEIVKTLFVLHEPPKSCQNSFCNPHVHLSIVWRRDGTRRLRELQEGAFCTCRVFVCPTSSVGALPMAPCNLWYSWFCKVWKWHVAGVAHRAAAVLHGWGGRVLLLGAGGLQKPHGEPRSVWPLKKWEKSGARLLELPAM